MARSVRQRRALHLAAPAAVLVLASALALAIAPPVSARTHVAAAVTTTSVSYRFDAQLVAGAYAGSTLHGWLSGSLDSTGLLTATLTTDLLAPLKAGCAAYVDFGPACGLPPTANVRGHVLGKGATSSALLSAAGKGWTWLLAGAAVGTAGRWAGTLTRGSAYMGTWSLTPQVATLSIQAGTKADAKSKDKVVLVGAINLGVTADGWAVGTFSPADGTLPTVVQGYVNAKNGSLVVNIPMGKKGTVLLTAWSRPGFGVLNWTGTFVGPAAGDYGTWLGRG
jgi:hypothetical protein